MIRMFALLLAVVSFTVSGDASNSRGTEPIATLDLFQLPAGTKDASAQLIAFISDTSIAISLCPNGAATTCSLLLLRREGNTMRAHAASALHFGRGRSIHVSSEGQILITPFGRSNAVLFTPDLSVTQELRNVFSASPSGNTGADITKEGWRLYQIRSHTRLIREGKGSFRSVSDEVIVFQDGNRMRIETLEGTSLGSFSVKPENKCYNIVYPLDAKRLYFDNCKKIRIVDFGGREQSELHAPTGSDYQFWSRDGTRLLFDSFDRKISVFRNAGEILLALGTLGAGALDQQNNREEVRVVDTSTSGTCFSWKRSFPMGGVGLVQDATISPSGEFVAVAAGGILSVYRLPEHCGNRN